MPSFLCEIKAHLMFRLFMQWTENYVCGEVDMVELWEQAVVAANRLIKGEGEEALKVSNCFCLTVGALPQSAYRAPYLY